MDLIHVVIVLIVIGVLLWFVNTKIPMDATIKTVINVVVCLVVILWILGMFVGDLPHLRVGK